MLPSPLTRAYPHLIFFFFRREVVWLKGSIANAARTTVLHGTTGMVYQATLDKVGHIEIQYSPWTYM